MASLVSLFFSIYMLAGIAIFAAGLGGLIYYLARAKKERDSETFEARRW